MSSEAIKEYGTYWCGDCYRARYFLEQKHIPYQWIEIDKSESARKSVMELNHGKAIVPTIIFPDGSMLSEPTFSELTEKIGSGSYINKAVMG